MSSVETTEQVVREEVRPLVKWAGGKTQLLPDLVTRMPSRFGRYFEPFFGGGALFFHLQPSDAVVSDFNPRLVNLYLNVRDNPSGLIRECQDLSLEYEETEPTAKAQYFYDRRDEFNSTTDSPTREAALFLFLNKTGFNGLYRENSRGHFNVPFGQRPHVSLINETNVWAASRALARARILHMSFEGVLNEAEEGDFVYFDPPYVPLEGTPSFTSYLKGGFGPREQEHLADVFSLLARRGVHVMLSNSMTPSVLELYAGHNIEIVDARRNINSVGTGRGMVQEVVVTA